ncbi:50S ribosomal protein L10 [Escherichia coli]
MSAVVADSRGVTVDKMTELRKAGREAGVYMRVVRNTLLRRAVEGTPFECLKDAFVGPTPDCILYGTPGRCCSSVQSSRKRMQNLRSKPLPLKGELIPGVSDRPPGNSADLRRSNCTPDGNHERSFGWQTGSYSGCCTRCERSCLIAVIFLTHSLTYKLM